MKVTLVMVSSVDGKTTRWGEGDIHKWVSKEDQKHFARMRSSHQVLIMGRKTYDTVKPKPERKPFRIVLTHTPSKYKKYEVPQQLEFTNEKPEQLIGRLKKFGYESILLVGGGSVTRDFLKTNLVDEIFLTIEPYIFGKGHLLIDPARLELRLHLRGVKQINKTGTMLVHYLVEK